jgi:hypothetical protein
MHILFFPVICAVYLCVQATVVSFKLSVFSSLIYSVVSSYDHILQLTSPPLSSFFCFKLEFSHHIKSVGTAIVLYDFSIV